MLYNVNDTKMFPALNVKDDIWTKENCALKKSFFISLVLRILMKMLGILGNYFLTGLEHCY